jgi:hypothetical protein
MPLTIKSWTCSHQIINTVWVLPLGEDYVRVFADLNTDGKNAEIVGVSSDEDMTCGLMLDCQPVDPGTDRRVPLDVSVEFKVRADEPIYFVAASGGRYHLSLVVGRASARQNLGEEIPQVAEGK